jgi:HD superfamily phosphohydrolase
VRLQEDPLNVVFSKKAQHAAAHMLESRVYDYLTTSYHKTVKSLELELIEAILAAFQEGELPFKEEDLKALTSSSDWDAFDDGHARSTLLKSKSSTAEEFATRVFGRSPRKTLYTRTLELSKRRWQDYSGYQTFRRSLKRTLERTPPKDVPAGQWFVQTVEALDASDASTFAEIDRASALDNPELDVLSQVSKLRDRVTLVLHYYLGATSVLEDGYKSKYEHTLDEFVSKCMKEAGDEVAKLTTGEGA